jgi:predicted nucleic acid-binding protein
VRHLVSDTGPLLHLYEAACLDLLEHAGTIAVPQAVDSEMAQHVREWRTRKPSWITVTSVITPYDAQATAWQQSGLLEVGEAEAIALAHQLGAAWFLTDDAAARVFAAALGLEVHGSLGIVLWATARDISAMQKPRRLWTVWRTPRCGFPRECSRKPALP